MKAILFVLLITGTNSFESEGKVDYTLVDRQADVSWEQCSTMARDINVGGNVEVGNVTAVCFPYTLNDEKVNNERSR